MFYSTTLACKCAAAKSGVGFWLIVLPAFGRNVAFCDAFDVIDAFVAFVAFDAFVAWFDPS